MFKPKAVHSSPESPGELGRPRRRKRLRTVATLPALLTLGNLYFGFAAIYCCGREMHDVGKGVTASEVRTLHSDFFEARAPSYLSIAAWMVFAAMACDALDGRVARLTKGTSKFGMQLDSLADMVSFGAAPALMMITLTQREIGQLGYAPFGFQRFGQTAVFIGGIYACCTALRLARFNVEASIEEAQHHGFRGLPSPGGAAAVVAAIFLHDHLDMTHGWPAMAAILFRILPVFTLTIALLMVSRLPYSHAVSSFLRRRPFWHLIPLLLVVPLIQHYTEETTAVLAWSFAASGPVRYFWRRVKGPPTQVLPTDHEELRTPETLMKKHAP